MAAGDVDCPAPGGASRSTPRTVALQAETIAANVATSDDRTR